MLHRHAGSLRNFQQSNHLVEQTAASFLRSVRAFAPSSAAKIPRSPSVAMEMRKCGKSRECDRCERCGRSVSRPEFVAATTENRRHALRPSDTGGCPNFVPTSE